MYVDAFLLLEIISKVNSLSKAYKYDIDILLDGMICGGDTIDTCSGDSGGPIVANINGQFTLIGITSFGQKDGCGIEAPALYADVSYPEILTFINSVN